MKKTLTIEADSYEDEEVFDAHLKGFEYKMVISELDQWLRNKAKYEDLESVSIDELRTKIRELLSENNLSI